MWYNITIILLHWQAQMLEYKEIYNNELYKRRSRDTKKKLENRTSDSLPMIHASAAHLWLAIGRIHKFQAPRSGHKVPRESELPNEWCDECQVACRDKHMCVDKSKS